METILANAALTTLGQYVIATLGLVILVLGGYVTMIRLKGGEPQAPAPVASVAETVCEDCARGAVHDLDARLKEAKQTDAAHYDTLQRGQGRQWKRIEEQGRVVATIDERTANIVKTQEVHGDAVREIAKDLADLTGYVRAKGEA